MKTLLTTALCALITVTCFAADITPVTWIHTASGKEVFVAAYWSEQFPNRQASASRHLIFMCFKTTWQGYTQAQRDWVTNVIGGLLAGSARLSRANLDTWVAVAAARGITFIPLGPSPEHATVATALYFVICPVGKSAVQALTWLGLEPPSSEEI